MSHNLICPTVSLHPTASCPHLTPPFYRNVIRLLFSFTSSSYFPRFNKTDIWIHPCSTLVPQHLLTDYVSLVYCLQQLRTSNGLITAPCLETSSAATLTLTLQVYTEQHAELESQRSGVWTAMLDLLFTPTRNGCQERSPDPSVTGRAF